MPLYFIPIVGSNVEHVRFYMMKPFLDVPLEEKIGRFENVYIT